MVVPMLHYYGGTSNRVCHSLVDPSSDKRAWRILQPTPTIVPLCRYPVYPDASMSKVNTRPLLGLTENTFFPAIKHVSLNFVYQENRC